MRAAALPKETFRRRLYVALEGGRLGGPWGIAVEITLVTLIILNVFAYTFASVPEFAHAFRGKFLLLEIVSVAIFTIEYALRLWSAPEDPSVGQHGALRGRFRFALRPMMIIDLLSIAPAYVAVFVPFIDLRALRVVRLLRLLKIARYSPALSALAQVITEERRALFGCFLLFLCALLFTASAMHLVEGASQPMAFGTIPASMWWAVSTLTTVGYGDVIPHTALGRIVAGVTMIVGLSLAALPVGIVATGFARSIHRRDFVVTFAMLARVPIFQGLDAQSVGEIMDLLRAQSLGQGDIVSARGERAAALYFVVAGMVEAHRYERTLRFQNGDFFGELVLFDDAMREATIFAVRPARLLVLEAPDFERLLQRRPHLRDHMNAVVEQIALGDREMARFQEREPSGGA